MQAYETYLYICNRSIDVKKDSSTFGHATVKRSGSLLQKRKPLLGHGFLSVLYIVSTLISVFSRLAGRVNHSILLYWWEITDGADLIKMELRIVADHRSVLIQLWNIEVCLDFGKSKLKIF